MGVIQFHCSLTKNSKKSFCAYLHTSLIEHLHFHKSYDVNFREMNKIDANRYTAALKLLDDCNEKYTLWVHLELCYQSIYSVIMSF